MKKRFIYIINFLLLLMVFVPSISNSLERDYAYSGDYLDDDREPDDEDDYG